MGSHREQYIWKRGVKMAINCYQITQHFPTSELYGLTSQIRRSCVSVPSNIAEGYGRTSKVEYIHFLRIALGSLRELDTQLIIAKAVNLAKPELFNSIIQEVDELQRLIIATIRKLEA
ncbi:MAG: four helix bundle protein [Okeania sp. SIO2C2]|uniref:four helix bundle protein n=1 Tax=Okeania sp. SIO2C2 TaxID=2607787 RepID=UPI0013BD6A0F|nr:four helix bundle protein [Okeania sp. SIO2C2]NEP86914.1 four helix bundle protein [Okeania sp. SIO2C2]